MNRHHRRDEGTAAWLGATILLARAARPTEIVGVVAFLASPKGGSITGAVITADGGWTAIQAS